MFYLLEYFLQTVTASFDPYTQLIFRNLGYSQSKVGVIIAAGQLASIFFPIVAGLMMDRTGKAKVVLVVASLASGVFIMPATISKVFPFVIFMFFLSKGFVSVINPAVDGYITKSLKGDTQKYGLARAAGTGGYVVFLVAASVIGFPEVTDNRQILICYIISLVAFVVCVAFCPEMPQTENKDHNHRFFDVNWFDKSFYVVMLAVGISRVAQTIPDRLLGSYMTEELHLGGHFPFYVAIGAFSEILMLIIGGKLIRQGKVSYYTMLILSTVALIVRLYIYAYVKGKAAFIFAQTLHSFTYGACHIAITNYISLTTSKKHNAFAMSWYTALAINFPQMLGVFFGGFIIDNFGYGSLFRIYGIFPVIALLILVVFRKTIILRREK